MSSRILLALFVSLAVISLVGCAGSTPDSGIGRGKVLYDGCASCHGPEGAGNPVVGAPSIAGLPEWYILEQLGKFKSGLRAYHGDDITGLRMRPMTLMLRDDNDQKSVAAFISALPPVASTKTVEGDASAGQAAYAVCTACHGVDGSGNEALKSPPIKLLPDWYVAAQLRKFRSGVRGGLAADVTGAQMRAMSLTLVDDAAVNNVTAYIQSL